MVTTPMDEIGDFVRLLRERGIGVGISEHVDARFCYDTFFRGDEATDLDSKPFLSLRSVLVKRRDDYDAFSMAYEDYFLLHVSRWQEKGRVMDFVSRFARRSRSRTDVSISSMEQVSEEGKRKSIISLYSANKARIPSMDIGNLEVFKPEDIKFMARKLRKISRLNKVLPGRRRSPHSSSNRDRYVDWKKLARTISSNPDAIPRIRFRKKKQTRSKIVVMADVSGSMLKEAGLVINSLFTASRRFHGSEVFVFSTSLSRLTSFFSNASPSYDTLSKFYSKQTEIELGSGTRIGENLARVLTDFPATVSEETTLVMISDGWDLGDSGLLEECLSEVKKRGGKIVWFHPHYGYHDFSPATTGMKTALPYIDLMLGPHSVADQKVDQ